MNKAQLLFDKEYVKGLLERNVLPHYPHFRGIKNIKIIAHKKGIWISTYHVVAEYRVRFDALDGKAQTLPVFCSAHSSEPRRNVYEALDYLWKHSFGSGYCTVPRPLFYSSFFRATFYRGVEGRTLYHYIITQEKEVLRYMVPKAAKWFAKLHRLPVNGAPCFNRLNSRIRTVVPGYEKIMDRVGHQYPRYLSDYKHIYAILIKREEEALASLGRRWLVHGDAHPENIVKMGKKKLAMIDYTDICLSDFARDIGTIVQQLEYSLGCRMNDRSFANELTDLFQASYYQERKIKPDVGLEERVRTYYLWTMMRTATHFLMKDKPRPERAIPLLETVKRELC